MRHAVGCVDVYALFQLNVFLVSWSKRATIAETGVGSVETSIETVDQMGMLIGCSTFPSSGTFPVQTFVYESTIDLSSIGYKRVESVRRHMP